jgi:hypothetical protein
MLNNNAELDNGVYNENEKPAPKEVDDGLIGFNQQIEANPSAPDLGIKGKYEVKAIKVPTPDNSKPCSNV